MTDSEQLMRTLVLGVAHLCERTDSLAHGEARETLTLAPVRESLEIVWRTFQALEREWDNEAPPGQLPPGVPGNLNDTNSWLVDVAALLGPASTDVG